MRRKNGGQLHKGHRTKAQHRRAAEAYVKSDGGHWVRRIANEMKQSPRVIEAVTSGRLDRWLEGK